MDTRVEEIVHTDFPALSSYCLLCLQLNRKGIKCSEVDLTQAENNCMPSL